MSMHKKFLHSVATLHLKKNGDVYQVNILEDQIGLLRVASYIFLLRDLLRLNIIDYIKWPNKTADD